VGTVLNYVALAHFQFVNEKHELVGTLELEQA